MYMECRIRSGKKSTKNNYFSLSLGINSTKLHGLWFISNWWTRILSHASVTPPEEPGRAKMYLPFANTAQALDWIDDVPTVSRLTTLKISPKPGISLSAISFTASGVMSLPVNPVPPVVIITSIFLFFSQYFRIFLMSFLLSLQIFLSIRLCLAFLIF